MDKLSASQAVKLLGISTTDLNILEKQGIIHFLENANGEKNYSQKEIMRIKSASAPALSEEAALVGVQIQQEIVSSVSGVDLNPGTSSKSYSLCASTSAGDTNVQNWRVAALVIE